MIRSVSQLSVRTRLTLWYVGVLASILFVYVVAVLAFQYAQLQRQMYHDEVQDVETVEGLFRFDQKGQLELQQDYFVRPKNRLLVDRLMEVQDPSGKVLYRAAPSKGRLWDPLHSQGREKMASTNEPSNSPMALVSSS